LEPTSFSAIIALDLFILAIDVGLNPCFFNIALADGLNADFIALPDALRALSITDASLSPAPDP